MSKKLQSFFHHNKETRNESDNKTHDLDNISIELPIGANNENINQLNDKNQPPHVIVESFHGLGHRDRVSSESVESIDQIPESQESPKSQANSRLNNIIHKFHAPRAYKYNADEQENLIKEYQSQLYTSLSTYKQILRSDPDAINAEAYFQYGLIYKKLARTLDLSSEDSAIGTNNATLYREKALGYFNKAIKLGEKNKSSSEVLAKYHAAKAKAYYYMKNLDLAKEECAVTLSYCPTNLKAHEVMGHIYKTEKKYNLALNSFENSAGEIKNNIHYVTFLYNKSLILAMLGRQEEATNLYNLANSISLSTKNIDMEDRILALGMRNPLLEATIQELPDLVRKLELLDTPQNSSVKDILSDIDTNNSPGKVAKLLNEVEIIRQSLRETEKELKAEKLAHLNDTEKLTKELRRLESEGNEASEIESKDLIDKDPYLSTFYKEIKRHLINTYHTTQSIDTGLVANNKTGNLGQAAKAIDLANDFIPAPKVVSLPLKAASLGLAAMDEAYQAKCIDNFNNIADDERDMKILSKAVAMKITLQRIDEIDDQTTKSNKSDIKKLAKSDAAKIAKFIEEIIFDGRITADDLNDKVNMIVALVEIDQNYNNDNLENLPKYTKESATKILEKIKTSYEHWHSNEKLEQIFINTLSEEIKKSDLQENVVMGDVFITSLAFYIRHDTRAVESVHRTFKFWEHKGKLSEDFLSSSDYFKRAIDSIVDTSAVVSVGLSDSTKGDDPYGQMVPLDGEIADNSAIIL